MNLIEQIENYIGDIYYKLFDLVKLDQYATMLLEAGYIFYLNKDFERANITVNLAEALKNNMPVDIVSIYIKEVLENLNSITGENVVEDVINEIKPSLDYSKQVIVSVIGGVGSEQLDKLLLSNNGLLPQLYLIIPNTAIGILSLRSSFKK